MRSVPIAPDRSRAAAPGRPFVDALRTLGVGMETRVLMRMLDGIDFPAVFGSAIEADCVPVPLDALPAPGACVHLLRDSR